MCDRSLEQPLDDVESELVRFLVEKIAEVPCLPSEDKPYVSQHASLFVADILRIHLPRVFYAQGRESQEESPIIALAQPLPQTLDIFFKKPCV